MKFRMTQSLKLTLCVLSFLLAQSADEVVAQQRRDNDRAPSVVAYRLNKWKTMHFDDAAKAKQHATAVRNLGCETKTNRHGDHIDVTYRQVDWTPLTLSSDEVAYRWQAWLDAAGFESLHGHGDPHDHEGHDHDRHDHSGNHGHNHGTHDHAGHDHGSNGSETITYRLIDWKTMRFDTRSDADQFTAIALGLGCELQNNQGDARDVTVRCRDWKYAEFTSHASATSWEHWLAGCGFDALHEHGPEHGHTH